jgi:hypothetical protein
MGHMEPLRAQLQRSSTLVTMYSARRRAVSTRFAHAAGGHALTDGVVVVNGLKELVDVRGGGRRGGCEANRARACDQNVSPTIEFEQRLGSARTFGLHGSGLEASALVQLHTGGHRQAAGGHTCRAAAREHTGAAGEHA